MESGVTTMSRAVPIVADEKAEHERWVGAMADQFSHMVSAVAANRRPDEQKELMREFIAGLESHFDQKYKAKWGA